MVSRASCWGGCATSTRCTCSSASAAGSTLVDAFGVPETSLGAARNIGV